MFMTPPLATLIAELHLEHHSKHFLTTGAARFVALAKMFLRKSN
jgi:hypothetical protein